MSTNTAHSWTPNNFPLLLISHPWHSNKFSQHLSTFSKIISASPFHFQWLPVHCLSLLGAISRPTPHCVHFPATPYNIFDQSVSQSVTHFYLIIYNSGQRTRAIHVIHCYRLIAHYNRSTFEPKKVEMEKVNTVCLQ